MSFKGASARNAVDRAREARQAPLGLFSIETAR
jgi:hypothetical protein